MVSSRKPDTTTDTAETITDVHVRKAVAQAIRAMANEATVDTTDPSMIEDDVSLNAMLTAESDEEIWDADERGPLGFRDLDGCELALTDVQVKYSRSNVNSNGEEIKSIFVAPDGRKMYLLVTCYRLGETGDELRKINLPAVGETFQANTSARYVAMKIWAFYTRGRIDSSTGAKLECRVKATELDGDRAVIKLRPLVKRSTVQA